MRPALFTAWCLVLLALPSQGVVVQYTATFEWGRGNAEIQFGPMGVFGGPRALPMCNQGLQLAMNGSLPGAGVANVKPAGTITFPGPYFYGTPAPTGAFPTLAKPGVAGANGFARYTPGPGFSNHPPGVPGATACDARYTDAFLPASWQRATERGYFAMPASATPNGAALQQSLKPGGGPAPLTVTVPGRPWTSDVNSAMMAIGTASNNDANFGGPFDFTGGGRLDATFAIPLPVDLSWYTGPYGLGSHDWAVQPTGSITNIGLFQFFDVGTTAFPLQWRAHVFPFTVGKVRVHAPGSNGPRSTRTISGFDDRNAAGTLGTLQLVSPWLAQVTGLPFQGTNDGAIYQAGTRKLTFHFLPEPRATAMLCMGVLTILGLAKRRRSTKPAPARSP